MKSLSDFINESTVISEAMNDNQFWKMFVDIKNKYWKPSDEESNPFAVALKKKAYTWDELCEFGDKFYDLAMEIDKKCEWTGDGGDDEHEYSIWGKLFDCDSKQDFQKIIRSKEIGNSFYNGEAIAPPTKEDDEEDFIEYA